MFMVPASPVRGRLDKNALGMLNVLPPVVHVKHKSQHIVARKCNGCRIVNGIKPLMLEGIIF